MAHDNYLMGVVRTVVLNVRVTDDVYVEIQEFIDKHDWYDETNMEHVRMGSISAMIYYQDSHGFSDEAKELLDKIVNTYPLVKITYVKFHL